MLLDHYLGALTGFQKAAINSTKHSALLVAGIVCLGITAPGFGAAPAKAPTKSKSTSVKVKAPAPVLETPAYICAIDNDFVILPLCSFAKGSFNAIWSKPDSFTDAYKPAVVQTFPQSMKYAMGGSTGSVTLDKLIKIDAQCSANWAYLTSKTPRDKAVHRQSLKVRPFKGLATNAAGLSFACESAIVRSSEEYAQYKDMIVTHFGMLEESKIAELAKRIGSGKGFVRSSGFPLARGDREFVSTSIDLFSVAVSAQSQPLYRFHVVKRYPHLLKKENIDCADVITYSGFIVNSNGAGSMLKDVDCVVDNCEGLKTPIMQGLGTFSIAGQCFWIGRRSFVEAEFYDIYELKGGSISKVFEINGGSCIQ